MRCLSLWCGVVWCGVVWWGVPWWDEMLSCSRADTLSVAVSHSDWDGGLSAATGGLSEVRGGGGGGGRAELDSVQVWSQLSTALVTVSSSLPLSLALVLSKKMVSSKTIKYFCLTGAGVTSSQSNKTQQEITFFLQPSHCASACSIKMIFLTEKMKFEVVVVS